MRLHLTQWARRTDRGEVGPIAPHSYPAPAVVLPPDLTLLATQAPAADHAHLCDHAPDDLGGPAAQGCPRWPACVSLDPARRASS